MLELYNTTKQIKKIPKYRYNGTYTINPFDSVDIEDDQAYFFKPYSRVGIVIRCKSDSGAERAEQAEKVVKEQVKSEVKVEPIKEKVEEVKEEVKSEVEEAQPEVEDVVDTIESEDKVEEFKQVYTKESFDGMSLAEIKDLAESMGLDTSNCKRRVHAIDLILDSQK